MKKRTEKNVNEINAAKERDSWWPQVEVYTQKQRMERGAHGEDEDKWAAGTSRVFESKQQSHLERGKAQDQPEVYFIVTFKV